MVIVVSSRAAFHSIAALAIRVKTASSASTEATVKAAWLLYSFQSFSMRNGMVSFTSTWPDTTDTAPNSPKARAVHRITP